MTNTSEYQIEWVPGAKASQPNPFNILILGDGFTASERAKFEDATEKIAENLFRIPPFNFCKPYINILRCVIASENSGVTTETVFEDRPRTALRLYKTANGQILPSNKTFLVDFISNLNLPDTLEVPVGVPRTPAGIWFNPRVRRQKANSEGLCPVRTDIPDSEFHCPYHLGSKSHGAVGIMANCADGTGINLPELDLVGEVSVWKLFTFSLAGYRAGPSELAGTYLNVFVHELAHSLHLGDEYEKKSGYAIMSDEKAEIYNRSYANIQYIWSTLEGLEDELPQRIQEIFEALPWTPLMADSEKAGILSKSLIFSKKRLKTIGWVSDVNDVERDIRDRVPILDIDRQWDQIFLIEGAGQFARNIYRSNFDCRMRHHQYDKQYTTDPDRYSYTEGDTSYYGAPDFCRVCNYQIRKHITGWDEFGIGYGTNRLMLLQLFYGEVMQKINKSFDIQNASARTDYATNKYYCDVASARAFIILRQKGLNVQFVISGLHVSLYCNGIHLDPTFFDFYRVPGESGPLRYRTVDGQEKTFLPEDFTKRGFAGDLLEFEGFLNEFIPRDGSYIQRSTYALPAYTQEMTESVYKVKRLWKGPGRESEQTVLDELTNLGVTGSYLDPIRNYMVVINEQWQLWQGYLKNRSPAFLKPLKL